jgi:hypothetical protein
MVHVHQVCAARGESVTKFCAALADRPTQGALLLSLQVSRQQRHEPGYLHFAVPHRPGGHCRGWRRRWQRVRRPQAALGQSSFGWQGGGVAVWLPGRTMMVGFPNGRWKLDLSKCLSFESPLLFAPGILRCCSPPRSICPPSMQGRPDVPAAAAAEGAARKALGGNFVGNEPP